MHQARLFFKWRDSKPETTQLQYFGHSSTFSAIPICCLANGRAPACLRRLALLLLSDSIHRLAEVLGFVKLVMHDVRLRYALLGSIHVCGPHVHGHRFEGLPLI